MRGGDSTPPKRQHSLSTFIRSLNTSIDDLPDEVLIEILRRLPCYKFVNQTKFVSKRWCTLTSNPHFICRFLSNNRQSQTLTNRTLINKRGEEFLDRMSSSPKPLSPLFKRIMSFHGLKAEPVVICTYNDLVLCSSEFNVLGDYYICNPYTMQWLPLPLPPEVVRCVPCVPVGFICDLPYYDCNKVDDEGRHVVQLNVEYRCAVMRLIFSTDQKIATRFKLQVFSSETGEWKESIVSLPSGIDIRAFYGRGISPFVYDGMQFWGFVGFHRHPFLIGLDPFMINNTISANGAIDHYKFRFIQLKTNWLYPVKCLGECRGGGVRMYVSAGGHRFSLWDFTEEEMHGASVELGDETINNYLEVDTKEWHDTLHVLGIDPNNEDDEDILYVQGFCGGDIYRGKISTTERGFLWAEKPERIAESWDGSMTFQYFPLVVPWWPTPLPRIPQHMKP